MEMSRQKQSLHIDVIHIKYNTTWCNLFPVGLPDSLVCNICRPKLNLQPKKLVNQKTRKDIIIIQMNLKDIGPHDRVRIINV